MFSKLFSSKEVQKKSLEDLKASNVSFLNQKLMRKVLGGETPPQPQPPHQIGTADGPRYQP